MLRVLAIALPLGAVAGAVAYLLAPAGGASDSETAALSREPTFQAEPVVTPPVEEARVPYPPRNVTPPGIYTGPIRSFEPPPSPKPSESPEVASRTLHRVVVDSAGVLRAGELVLRLDGIEAPDLDATCRAEDEAEWPCGRAATAALRLLVRNRAVDCDIREGSADGHLASCTVAGRDLAGWLVQQGWAEPIDGTRFQAELEVARTDGRGMFATARDRAPPPVEVPIPTATAPAQAE